MVKRSVNILKEEQLAKQCCQHDSPKNAKPMAPACVAKEVLARLLAKLLKGLQPHTSGVFRRPKITPIVL